MNKKLSKVLHTGIATAMMLSMGNFEVFAEETDSKNNGGNETETTSGNTEKISINNDSNTEGKDETVYVITDASGEKQNVIVSDWLKNGSSSDIIKDYTTLKDIVNVKGDETYSTNNDGSISWNAEGNDIYYQGTTDAELPVAVKISYQLDGADISAEDLAGKSGHVTIRFDYENNSTKDVMINGKKTTIKTPFAMVSGLELPNDKFSNIQVENGKVISEGDNAFVIGMAFPGLKESLDLDDDEDLKDKIGDIEIPEYVQIEADVTDFSLEMTMTLASSSFLSDLKVDDDGTLDELKDDMNTLQSSAQELVDGTQTLKDGTGDLVSGVNRLKSGSSDLNDGAKQLADGLVTFDNTLASNAKDAETASAAAQKKAEAMIASLEKQLANPMALVKQLQQQGILTEKGELNSDVAKKLTALGVLKENGEINGQKIKELEAMISALQNAGVINADGTPTAVVTGLLKTAGVMNESGIIDAQKLHTLIGTLEKTGTINTTGSLTPETKAMLNSLGVLDANGNLDAAKYAEVKKNGDQLIDQLIEANVLTVDSSTGSVSMNQDLVTTLAKLGIVKVNPNTRKPEGGIDPKELGAAMQLTSLVDQLKQTGIVKDDKDDKDDKLSDTYTSLIAQKIIDQDGKLTDTAKTNLTQTITTLTQLGVIDSEGNLDQTKLAQLTSLPAELKELGLVKDDGMANAEAVTLLTSLQSQFASIGCMNDDGSVNQKKLDALVAQLKQAGIIGKNNQIVNEKIQNYESLIGTLISRRLLNEKGLDTTTLSAANLSSIAALLTNGMIIVDNKTGVASFATDAKTIAILSSEQYKLLNGDGTPTPEGTQMLDLVPLAVQAGLVTSSDNKEYAANLTGLETDTALISLAQSAGLISKDDKGNLVVNEDKVKSLRGIQEQLATAGLLNDDGTLNSDKITQLSNMSALVKKLAAAGITDEQGNVNKEKLDAFIEYCKAGTSNSYASISAEAVTANSTETRENNAVAQIETVTEEKMEPADTAADETEAPDQTAEDKAADTAATVEAAPAADTAATDTQASVNTESSSDETTESVENSAASEAEKTIADLKAQLAAKDDEIASLKNDLQAANDAKAKAEQSAADAVAQANQERDDAIKAKEDAEGKLAFAQQALTAATADKTGDSGSDHTAADNSAVTQSADMSNVTPAQMAAVLASSSSDTGDFSLTEEQIKAILTEYTKTVAEAAGQAGAKQAIDTIRSNADYKKLIDGARQLSDGASELNSGVNTLQTGALQLDDGAQELLDGMTKFKEEGIDKLADLFGDNLTDVIDRLKEVCDAGAEYSSFAGNDDNGTNTVKFIFKTDAIKSASDSEN